MTTFIAVIFAGVIIAMFALTAIGIVASTYQWIHVDILPRRKAKLVITVPDIDYYYGDTLKVSCTLHTRSKITDGSLWAIITANHSITTTGNTANAASTTTNTVIYEKIHLIDEFRDLPKGHDGKYSFQVDVPDLTDSDFKGSKLFETLKEIVINHGKGRIKWKLRVCLEYEGYGYPVTEVRKARINLSNGDSVDLFGVAPPPSLQSL